MERTSKAIDSLFPTVRRHVLSTTLLNPQRRWYLRELAARIDVTPSSLQRELQNLVDAGILTRVTDGNRAYFQADTSSPLFPELQGLMKKTLGGVDALREALEPLGDRVQLAFVYGSFAARTEIRNTSDIDVMVVGSATSREVVNALSALEGTLGREVNPTVYTPKEFNEKLSQGNHFLTTVARSEKLSLIGEPDVLAALTK